MIPLRHDAWRPTPHAPLSRLHPAARLGAGVLAAVSALLVPAPALPVLAAALGWSLWRAGWQPAAALRGLRGWAPLLVIVLAAHTLSAADIAPVGRPSWVGLARGLLALGRLALLVAAGALTRRVLSLPDLSEALAWWLRPLRRSGKGRPHLDVLLSVAINSAPRTLAEAGRLAACLRLRRSNGRRRRGGWRLQERWLVVPPLMEGLVRRADSLPLALAGRVTAGAPAPAPLPVVQAGLLVAWLALLVWAASA